MTLFTRASKAKTQNQTKLNNIVRAECYVGTSKVFFWVETRVGRTRHRPSSGVWVGGYSQSRYQVRLTLLEIRTKKKGRRKKGRKTKPSHHLADNQISLTSSFEIMWLVRASDILHSDFYARLICKWNDYITGKCLSEWCTPWAGVI